MKELLRVENRAKSDIQGNERNKSEEKEISPSLRRCLITRQHRAPEEMLRFVVGPNDCVVPDLARRLPGRGLWICSERGLLEEQRLEAYFSRGVKRKVTLPPGFLHLIEAGLEKRLNDVISLGRRAGEAVCGFQKCREQIIAGRVGVVICAEDASRDELSRLVSGQRNVPVMWVPERVLIKAFGREKAVYSVMSSGGLAKRFMAEYKRFSGVALGAPPAPSGASKEQAEL